MPFEFFVLRQDVPGTIAGFPIWGTLIALLHKGTPVFGMMHQPFIGERFSGDTSVPHTCASRLSYATDRAIAPEPVPTSTSVPASGSRSSAHCSDGGIGGRHADLYACSAR